MSTNRVACYARVSTDQQSTGLKSQVRILKDYCQKNDILNYEIFVDEGISGTKSSRPALDRMMRAVNSGEVSSVVVYSFSRFARSTTHLLNALQIFKAKNVSFGSLTEKIDTSTPVGLAVFSILAAISQLGKGKIPSKPESTIEAHTIPLNRAHMIVFDRKISNKSPLGD